MDLVLSNVVPHGWETGLREKGKAIVQTFLFAGDKTHRVGRNKKADEKGFPSPLLIVKCLCGE